MCLQHCDLYNIEILDSDDGPLKCIYFFNKQLICLNSNSRFLLFSDMHKILLLLPDLGVGIYHMLQSSKDHQKFGQSLYAEHSISLLILFASLVFLLHFFILNLTIISLCWFSNPLSLHVFQINVTYLVWCQLGPALT